MKKLFIILMTVWMMTNFSGCNKPKDDSQDDETKTEKRDKKNIDKSNKKKKNHVRKDRRYRPKTYDVVDTELVFENEIEIEQTTQETPPPPPPPVVNEVEVLKVPDVYDDVETDEIEINTEDDKTEVEIQASVIIEEEEDDQVVYVIVENKPEFPGGDQALMKYISENIKYPIAAQENGIQGRVICQFVVNKDGSIVDIDVVRSVDPNLDKEAIRIIKSMPKWKPGKQRGKAVRVKFTLPIVFRLQ